MRWIAFLSRVGFICNLFFVASVLLQAKPVIVDSVVVSTIVILGYVVAPFLLSPLVNLIYLVLLLQRKPLQTSVPRWLMISNFIFLIVQLVFVLFFLHDPFHTA